MYFAIVYYTWIVAIVCWCVVARWFERRRRGWVLILIGAAIQLSAHGLHVMEWRRLAGEPDRLYVWIAPLALALVCVFFWLAGLVRQWSGMKRASEER